MGNCSSRLHLPNDLILDLSSSLDKNQLLMLNLQYNHYDRESKKVIDQLTSSAVNQNSAKKDEETKSK